MTIEDLALMVNRGFSETQKHIDWRIDKVEEIQKDMLEELNATHEDVRYIRTTVNLLVQSDASHDAALDELKARVFPLEQRAGLAT